jgi:simple sugar transport system ATP-binding protein
LRGGKVTGVCDPRQETVESLSTLMIGSAPPHINSQAATLGKTVLQVQGLSLAKSHPFATALHEINLHLQQGEILGLAGVSGNGQAELIAALSGEDTRAAKGSIQFNAVDVSALDAGERRLLGLAFVPEERLGRGAVPVMGLASNVALSHQGPPQVERGLIKQASLNELAQRVIKRFGVKTGNEQSPAKSLSGGNLQKFIVGREILREPKCFIVAQPTWGVDVGAAAQIRAELVAMKHQGCALLIISEEIDELFEICDRLQVIAQGKLSPSVAVSATDKTEIGLWMSGLWERADA